MPLPAGILSDLLAATPWMLLGATLGMAHLLSLRWTLALFTGRGSLLRALLLQAARLLVVLGVLTLAAVNGAAALLAAAGALLLVRSLLLRAWSRSGSGS